MRISWITAAAILISTQATAGLEQDLLSCSAKADKLDRLICYDQIATSVKSAPKVTSSTSTSTAAATTAVAATSVAAASQAQSVTAIPTTLPANIEDEFGNKNLKKTKEEAQKEITKIYMEIASISKDAYGALKISFSNGQVWKQSDSRRYKVKEGQSVFIEKAALGSFVLGTDERNSTIRVKRLK
ncbi:hypothetical protein FM037_24885 [Shewanella psychropiezotolerans]|uniref:Uncharacterized protein n=1 Tax=Shewanella psychropiezotolerans TaxID=2593655 RepID=A0ABX5X7L1_9GAMM|nr:MULTISPECIES: hypothetical protein [Shewanella]MPY26661.1 hypothetical protein [Shewanella sp. YLB-07]QDO85903.1 hypothetical protein FM037_24885 [Shewanella psychropiezotolerans]